MATPHSLTKDLTRLYLSPFSPALLPTFLSDDIQRRAQDISYHVLETFIDHPFGYVTLPTMDAKKVKSKLGGAILKGSKVRIEQARPASKRKIEEVDEEVEDDATVAEAEKKAKKEKRRKDKMEGVLSGVELEEGRMVQRGWTEVPEYKSKKEKKQSEKKGKKDRKVEKEKSKYTKEPEVLFKTKLPPNKVTDVTAADSTKSKKRKKTKNPSRETVVHEFEKTTKYASFLKAPAVGVKHDAATEYVDGKGWIDNEGEVVEKVKPARESHSKNDKRNSKKASKKKAPSPSPSPSSSEITSSDSSSDSSDDSSEDSDAEDPRGPTAAKNVTSTPEQDAKKKPNPLELLFKRQPGKEEKRPTPIDTSFNFFPDASERDSAEEDDLPTPGMDEGPQTPFTQHVESRWVSRSGAPTPDTAAVHRRFSFNRGVVDAESDNGMSFDQNKEDEEEDAVNDALSPVDEDEDETNGATMDGILAEEGDKDESAFAKWFWEKRGDNNRTWKRRRREAMKEKRQRDTRRLGRRIV